MPRQSSQRAEAPRTTKPARRSHKERIEQSDKRMLDAAEELILELGTHSTTLKAVGERAGYSRGLAHARFGSKEQLFIRLAERCLETWYEQVRHQNQAKSGMDALMSRLDAITQYAVNHPNDARVLYILWFESVGVSSPMKEHLSQFHQTARQDISDLLTNAREAGELSETADVEALTLLITSMSFGIAYQWLVDNERINVADAVDKLRGTMSVFVKPN